MGKKSKRRGGGKPKETHAADDDRDGREAVLLELLETKALIKANAEGRSINTFQQILGRFLVAASNPSELDFEKHKVLLTKRLKVATSVDALDEYRFAFDRLFVKVAAAAENIDALPDRIPSIDDDGNDKDDFRVLKEQSHDFINTPITDKIRKHSHFVTLSALCKIVMMACHFDIHVHLEITEALVPLFDRDAADLLRQVSSNDDELMSLRTMAMVARATIMFRNCNELNEASYRRRANLYFAQIADSEYPLVSGAEGVFGDLLAAATGIALPSYVSFFSLTVSGIIIVSNNRLRALEGPARLPQFVNDLNYMSSAKMSSEQVAYMAKFAFSVGGAFCDHCRKSREDASVVNFFKCGSCRLAHYCSKDCQKRAWDAGHNKLCRKAGCFNVGDLVIFGRPCQHATLVERCEDSKCKIAHSEKVAVVDKKELRHIRPLH